MIYLADIYGSGGISANKREKTMAAEL